MRSSAYADTGRAQTIAGSRMQGMSPEKLSRQWLTLVARLSVFPATPWEAPGDLWEQVVGEPPETSQDQPRQRLRLQTGPWRGGVLQVTASPVTVAWVAAPPPTSEGLPNFDDWSIESALPDFLKITRSWLTAVSFGVKRIGFGLHALLAAEDKIAAYQLLQGLVASVEINPETTTDLLYQINRPVLSRTMDGDIRLNRLMKWSTLLFGSAQFQATPPIAQGTPIAGRYYPSLEADVNTPAERLEPLAQRQLGAIYDELVGLAWENLEFGEKP